MATAFSDLHTLLRTLLGDHDPQKFIYSQGVLNQSIRLVIMTENNQLIQEGLPDQFDNDLTAVQKAEVIFRTAKQLIAPQDNEFGYKTPVLTARRKGGVAQLMAFLDEKISEIAGDSFPVASETELDALILFQERYAAEIDDAFSKSP